MVDYALRRRALLTQYRQGRVSRHELCDADPYLRRAAKFHGQRMDRPCPVCRAEQLFLVAWIFGDELGRASGSARKPAELDRLANLFAEFTVYEVEVCLTCEWNHLVTSCVVGTGDTGREPSHPEQDQRSATP
jgi:hypothetical protein